MKGGFDCAARHVPASDPKPLLACGQRSAKDWLPALDRLTEGQGSYRDAATDPATLAEVASDPHAAVELRVAAATAVTRAGDAALVTRIRIAAEATADPNARTLLTRVATATDDAECAAVLDEVTARAKA